ncbi:uncharacterized protein LOC106662624 [Cimex lectularius]|uniref:Uncharacterized protein n=1 Tax=Cimex lectularius TaxID=79782 RepID=A0A8I6RAV8_CIMLE|nr:uncharacterized protein LOC106662624 [Cimex lectularius]
MSHANPALAYALSVALFIITIVSFSHGLKCYQCGQYTDGVGSITPCLNFTEDNLKECPSNKNQNCIKFVTEGSIVRECANECSEKRESWGTKVFCCSENACNQGHRERSAAIVLTAPLILLVRQVFKLTY